MDSYFRKAQTLKAGEKDVAVVRAASPQPAINRSQSIDKRVERDVTNKKVAYQADVMDVVKKVEEVKNCVVVLQNSVKAHQDEVSAKVDELHKQIGTVKQDTEQTKSERMKQKLDSFITSYNENEKAHSDSLVVINKEMAELEERVKTVENVL